MTINEKAIDPTTQLTLAQFDKANEILLNGMNIGQSGEQVRALLLQNVIDEETVARLNKHTGYDLDANTYASGLMIAFCKALELYEALTSQAQDSQKPRYYC